MSATGTVSKTFTTVDIRKVVEYFAADASMMAQSTGLASRDFIGKVVADLNKFAAARLLVSVKIMLKDAQGIKLCAAVYQVSEAAVGWVSERPGKQPLAPYSRRFPAHQRHVHRGLVAEKRRAKGGLR